MTPNRTTRRSFVAAATSLAVTSGIVTSGRAAARCHVPFDLPQREPRHVPGATLPAARSTAAADAELAELAERYRDAVAAFYRLNPRINSPGTAAQAKAMLRRLDRATETLVDAMRSRDLLAFRYGGFLWVDASGDRISQWVDFEADGYDLVLMIPLGRVASLDS